MLFLVACLSLAWASYPAYGIEFGHSYGSHMVLQRGPERAMLYGYANVVGDTVTVYKDGAAVGTTKVQQSPVQGHVGYWDILLPEESAHGPFTITASSSDGNVTMNDVLYGDVWVCSGQSNMYFKMRQVNNSAEEIKNSISFTDIRMQLSNLKASETEVPEASLRQHWTKPTAGQIEDFSAVCFLFGRNLQSQLNVPIGLIETSWGGTPVEAWSSPDALAACTQTQGKRAVNSHTPSALWNAMIEPFLKTTIKGAIWYQGESNAGHAALYGCQFKAMITDWRQKFHNFTKGQTSLQFPFGFVQLAPNQHSSVVGGFPLLRWEQTHAVGYVPNPQLPNTFMAVAVDLPDYHSPYGTIHPRFKQDVAERLALGARAVAYGEQGVVYQGPFPTAYHLDNQHHALEITFDKGTAQMAFHNSTGFEICCAASASSKCLSWHNAQISNHTATMVTVAALCTHGQHVAGVRYLWHTSPCEFKMCPLYGTTNNLPVPPFIKTGGFASGTGIIG